MLKRIIRLFFRTYGYRMVTRRYLIDNKGRTYCSISIFTEKNQTDRIIAFKYQNPGILQSHKLSVNNLMDMIAICKEITNKIDDNNFNENRANLNSNNNLIFKQIVRSIVMTYGYNFLSRKYLEDEDGLSYASINIVFEDNEDSLSIILIYHADEIQHVRILSKKNLTEIIDVCGEIIAQMRER